MRKLHVLLLVLVASPLMLGMGGECPANVNNTLPTGGDQQPGTSDPTKRTGIYVTNFGDKSVTVYALDASGDAAPVRTIKGANTGLNGCLGIARDTQRRVYVANRTIGTVTVFAPGANGDIAPELVLTNADMGSPEGISIDTSDGVFVSNCPTLGGLGGVAGVFHFNANSATSDFSISGANTGITVPVGLVHDEARNLFVANAFGGNVSLFAPGQSGNQFPVRSFNPGGNTQSIAYGSPAILLGNGNAGINQYHSTASGNTAFVGTLPNVGYTGGIYFDTDVTPPVVYVADFSGNAVHILQTVGVPPFLSITSKTTIQGPATGLKSPYGVLVIKS
jgi:hypothetical protein